MAPVNRFNGVGGEIGYRYYFGQLGPHGLYLGPSLLLGSYTTDLHGATTASTHVSFQDIGGALDVGYQAIFGNLLIGMGVGVQYVHASKGLPDQSAVATDALAVSAVRPRAALTIGFTF